MSPEPVVSNAGPLMVLAKLNLLNLLKQLYGEVLIAQAVYDEVVVGGIRQGYADAYALDHFLRLEQWHPLASIELGSSLQQALLDRGELESIAIAQARGALLLIDEERGRSEARQLGIKARGTLGVLVQAYRTGMIDAGQLRYNFGEIESRPDIWISPTLCRRVLQDVLGVSD